MTPRGKRYQKAYASVLLSIATGDLGSAKDLVQGTHGRVENVCYLVQQAIEKSIKAVLCHLEIEVVHTHDLEALVNCVPEKQRPARARDIGELTEYATVRRYEEGYEILTPADIASVFKLGEEVLSWAAQVVKN